MELLKNLSKSTAERAVFARQEGRKDINLIHYDDNELPWVYDKKDQLWFSYDGNFSRFSPDEKRAKVEIWNQRDEISQIKEQERIANNRVWSAIRLGVLERDNYRCQLCGKNGDTKLHIHHILKRVQGGLDFTDNLITVCPKCHYQVDNDLYNPDWT